MVAGRTRSTSEVTRGFAASRLAGLALHDVLLTRDELRGLMANLLISPSPPNGHIRLSAWLAQNADRVGKRYASELALHFR